MKHIRHYFNMVEILLALGVVAIGICSVMVLFPVGSAATRDAVMENYAANSADQMLHLIKFNLMNKQNLDNYIANVTANPADPPAGSLQRSEPDEEPSSVTADLSLENVGHWEMGEALIGGNTLKGGIYVNSANKNYFQIVVHRDDPDKALADVAPDKIDFRASACIWISQIQIDSTEASKLPYNMGARINLRISWPAELPPAARQSALYTLEIFKQ